MYIYIYNRFRTVDAYRVHIHYHRWKINLVDRGKILIYDDDSLSRCKMERISRLSATEVRTLRLTGAKYRVAEVSRNKGCEFFLGIDKRPCNICELCFHG